MICRSSLPCPFQNCWFLRDPLVSCFLCFLFGFTVLRCLIQITRISPSGEHDLVYSPVGGDSTNCLEDTSRALQLRTLPSRVCAQLLGLVAKSPFERSAFCRRSTRVALCVYDFSRRFDYIFCHHSLSEHHARTYSCCMLSLAMYMACWGSMASRCRTVDDTRVAFSFSSFPSFFLLSLPSLVYINMDGKRRPILIC